MSKIITELDLSPYVIQYWKDLGFCVHGEVSIFNTSLFIDHVAHTGPCCAPTHIVGIEMKKSASTSLINQLTKLDRKHVVHELWGICIATPREDTLTRWEGSGFWNHAGLLSWTEKGLETLSEPYEVKPYKRKMNCHKLLLNEHTKDSLAGYQSGQCYYHTHWKCVKSEVLSRIEHLDEFSAQDFLEIPELSCYKKPHLTITKVLREVEEMDRRIFQVGKEGQHKKYAKLTHEEDDLIDDRFLQLFDI